MHSTGTGVSFLVTTARFAYSAGSTPAGSTEATSMPVRWLAMMCAVRSNQKLLIWQSISPLPGIGSGSTTSNALRRSVATINRWPSPRSNTSRTLPRWIRFRPGRSDCSSVVAMRVGEIEGRLV